MLILAFCLAAAIALRAPGAPIGEIATRLLIEEPARRARHLTGPRVVAAAIAGIAIAGFIAFAKLDGLILMGYFIPNGVAWFAAFDVATWVDVLGAALMVAAALRFRAGVRVLFRPRQQLNMGMRGLAEALRRRVQGGQSRAGSRRRRPARSTPPQSEDGGWPGLAGFWPDQALQPAF
jgi:hypothetical protein